jgi:hypothetical protein
MKIILLILKFWEYICFKPQTDMLHFNNSFYSIFTIDFYFYKRIFENLHIQT